MIRKSIIQDAGAIRVLLNQLEYPTEDGFIEDKLPDMLAHPDQELLVYEYGKNMVGFVSMHFVPQIALSGAFAIISYLAVDAGCRNKGICAELESYCTKLAKLRKCHRIQLHCHIRREDAHRFYDRLGFQEPRKYLTKNLNDKSQ
jgi:N-acetylglutamate synthase-like GNAT family acetyltransferase